MIETFSRSVEIPTTDLSVSDGEDVVQDTVSFSPSEGEVYFIEKLAFAIIMVSTNGNGATTTKMESRARAKANIAQSTVSAANGGSSTATSFNVGGFNETRSVAFDNKSRLSGSKQIGGYLQSGQTLNIEASMLVATDANDPPIEATGEAKVEVIGRRVV